MLKQNIVLPDLFTSKEVEAIMDKDARIVSLPKDTEAYKVENAIKYRVLLNTWMYMCSQYITPRCVNALMSMIRVKGLIPIISECSDLASEIVRSDFQLSELGSYYFLMNEDPRITLQLLRYPKRFSPCRASKLRDEGLQAFISLNRSLRGTPVVINQQGKVLERDTEYPTSLIHSVKGWIEEFLYGRAIIAWTPNKDQLLMEGRFSNGVSANGSKTLYEKYREWCELTPGYQDNFMYPVWRYGFHDYGERDDIDYVKAVAVPKSYKTPRIIAEVSAKCQFFQQGIRKWLLHFLERNDYSSYIILDDQKINQEWSRLGSIYGTYATIDLSSASDSISRHLAKKILPYGWFDIIEEFNPPFIMVNGKKEKRNILLTSGSGDTFVVESIIFLAIAFSAWEYVQIMCPDTAYLAPRVYGDDLICDSRCYDTTRDFLQKLGFTVNESKSFSDGRYRESCGAEWFCGLDTATKYFPRKAYDENSPEFLEGLIALQHRLYEFENCEQWLSAMIKQLYRTHTGGKELTSSYPGTECSDLWADFPYYYTVNPPYDRRGNVEETQQFIDANNIKREAHSALVRRKLPNKEVDRRFLEKYHRPFTWEQSQMMDMFRYVDFLRFGMQYDEYGIPIHQCPVSDDLIEPEVVWTTVTR